MAHTISAETRQRRAFAEPLARLNGFLLARCEACRCYRESAISDLATKHPGLTLGKAVYALRCRECRKPPSFVRLQAVSESARKQGDSPGMILRSPMSSTS